MVEKEWEITHIQETITGDTPYKKTILAVRRLSDGVEFRIGDRTVCGVIDGFKVINNNMFVEHKDKMFSAILENLVGRH